MVLGKFSWLHTLLCSVRYNFFIVLAEAWTKTCCCSFVVQCSTFCYTSLPNWSIWFRTNCLDDS
jgi:hypothetical protein